MSENMSPIEKEHHNLAVTNNNTYKKFTAKYGGKTIQEISNANPDKPSQSLFRGPDKDRYVLDPKDPNLIAIDMGHFFASAQAPFGRGVELGAIVELRQGVQRAGSAFQEEDYKANALGSVFGKYYLNNPAKGNTLKEKLNIFFQDYKSNSLQLSAPLHERLYDTPYGQNGRGLGQVASNKANQDSSSSTTSNDVNGIKEGTTVSSTLNSSKNQSVTDQEADSKTDVSKVVALLKSNAAEVKRQSGLDVNTDEGLGKAVMQYWKENNLDPKTLKEQLPAIKDSEFDTASKSLAKTNATEATNTKQLATQQR